MRGAGSTHTMYFMKMKVNIMYNKYMASKFFKMVACLKWGKKKLVNRVLLSSSKA